VAKNKAGRTRFVGIYLGQKGEATDAATAGWDTTSLWQDFLWVIACSVAQIFELWVEAIDIIDHCDLLLVGNLPIYHRTGSTGHDLLSQLRKKTHQQFLLIHCELLRDPS